MKKLFILSLCFCLSWLTSCYYDVEEELYPGPACDLTAVSFSNQITTTVQTYCLNCHSTAASGISGGGIVLETYAGVKEQVDNGKLISAVTHEGGASPMPKGSGSKIPVCNIEYIKTWIAAGSPNN